MPDASAVRARCPAHPRSLAVPSNPSAWLVRQLTAKKPNIARVVARATAEPETISVVGQTPRSATGPQAGLRRPASRPEAGPGGPAQTSGSTPLIAELAAGFNAKSPAVKFGSAKALWLAAEKAPEAVYPLFDFLVSQLENPNSILRWNATRALACLAPADRENKLDSVLDKYLSPIPGPQMIAAANAIAGAPEIALAKPYLADRIARAIMGVRNATFKTDECRNVALGHAIEALGRFFDAIRDQAAVIEFVRGQLENSRASTRRKAQEFLRRHAGWKRRP